MARTTNAVKHTHQYYRLNGLWYCSGIDGCTHFMPKNMPPPIGKNSRCWNCMNEFQLTPINMKEDKPICDVCSEKRVIMEAYLEDRLQPPNKPILNPTAEVRRRAEENMRKKREEEEKKLMKSVEVDEIETYEPTEGE